MSNLTVVIEANLIGSNGICEVARTEANIDLGYSYDLQDDFDRVYLDTKKAVVELLALEGRNVEVMIEEDMDQTKLFADLSFFDFFEYDVAVGLLEDECERVKVRKLREFTETVNVQVCTKPFTEEEFEEYEIAGDYASYVENFSSEKLDKYEVEVRPDFVNYVNHISDAEGFEDFWEVEGDARAIVWLYVNEEDRKPKAVQKAVNEFGYRYGG